MNITKENVNIFFQVKSKDTQESNNPDIPKINLNNVNILETIDENPLVNTNNSNLKINTSKEEKIKNKDSDSEDTAENIDISVEEIDDKNEENKNTKLDNLEVTENDIDKISSRQKNKKKQIQLLIQIFKILSFHVDKIEDLTNLTFPRETLLQKDNQNKLMDLIPQLKLVYNSSYLNCLHDNSIFKQKFPGVNLVRQVLKCNHLSLTPKIISNGYEKSTGKKKVSRIFKIEKQMF